MKKLNLIIFLPLFFSLFSSKLAANQFDFSMLNQRPGQLALADSSIASKQIAYYDNYQNIEGFKNRGRKQQEDFARNTFIVGGVIVVLTVGLVAGIAIAVL